MPLLLSTALTEQEWTASVRLARSWYYWPLRLIGDAHGYAFIYVAIFCAGAALLYPAYRTRDVLLGIPAALMLGVLLLWVTGLLRRRSVRKKVRRHNRQAAQAAIYDDGIMFTGANAVVPWGVFRRAIIGDGLLVLIAGRRRKRVQVFSITDVEGIQREELLATLREKLGPHRTKEAPIRGSRLRPNVVRLPEAKDNY